MKIPRGTVLVFGLMWASPTLAQTYKCTVAGQVTYSDQPCGAKASIVHSAPAMQGATGSNLTRQLDARVAAAIAEGDIGRAESLAVTADQWQMINQAKRDLAADAAVRRAEVDRAKQLKATQAAADAAAKQASKPTRCVTTSNTLGMGNSYGYGTSVAATTTGVTTCR